MYLVVTVAVLALVAVVALMGPQVIIGPKRRAVSDHRFEVTAARLERGKYLANGLGCLGCHSDYDETQHEPPLRSKPGAGRVFIDRGDFRIVARNITPDRESGIGAWSDEEIARAIREGVRQDGTALFPIMPYPRYRTMSDEDVQSIVVFLHTLEPVRTAHPARLLPFPLSRIVNTMPQPLAKGVAAPAMADMKQRGAYMTEIAACADCHTPTDGHGQPLPGMGFAGGMSFDGKTASANITPDVSGIRYYDEALFLAALRTGYVKARELRPSMPYWVYRNLSDDDLKAIFSHLRTLPPVRHRVDNAEPATVCKLCRQKHGAGSAN
jgi:mono/diheme cytochrome c family protein